MGTQATIHLQLLRMLEGTGVPVGCGHLPRLSSGVRADKARPPVGAVLLVAVAILECTWNNPARTGDQSIAVEPW
jgi:hypothetical protein